MVRYPARALLVLVALTGACSTQDEGTTATADDDIKGGHADTTHPAVVALLPKDASFPSGLCTGTLFKVDAARGVGWVLSAAHCATPDVALQGDDVLAPDVRRYPVVGSSRHPRYEANAHTYDFAVHRIRGVDATTPTMALTTAPDGIDSGALVTAIGYGVEDERMWPSSLRRAVQRRVSYTTDFLIVYRANDGGGACFGDSGGPLVERFGDTERVVGVFSTVFDSKCSSMVGNGRVALAIDFIESATQEVTTP